MTAREKVNSKREEMLQLCAELTIPALTVYFVDGEAWENAVFVANVDVSRLKGYARRFFALERGLLRIFHTRIEITEVEMFERSAKKTAPAPALELLLAS